MLQWRSEDFLPGMFYLDFESRLGASRARLLKMESKGAMRARPVERRRVTYKQFFREMFSLS